MHELTAELDFLQRSPPVPPLHYLNKNPKQKGKDLKYTAKHVEGNFQIKNITETLITLIPL